MKILLLGEYSHLHNTLKKGLQSLGHDVVLVGTGDGFKNYPVDIDVSSLLRKQYFLNKFYLAIYELTGYNHFNKDIYNNLMKLLPELSGFDVVQLINQDPFMIYPDDTIKFYTQLFKQNNSIFLLSCGEDSHIVDYYKKGGMRYSILDPYKDNTLHKKEAFFSYKYLTKSYQKLHNFVTDNISGIIPTDMDYAIPYQDIDLSAGMIPNPVNIDEITYKKLIINDKVNIFYGLNRLSYYKKGADIVLPVLDRIGKEYPEKVQIDIVENLPYNAYIKVFDNAHILIDQLYSYDQGYNALEAMAKGKCVLTGAEKEFVDYYGLNEEVAVNVLPNEEDLYQKLVALIQDKNRIVSIGEKARKFIEQQHDYKKIALRYIEVWQKKA